MNRVEKIKAEIKRRYNILKNVASPENKDYYDGKIEAYIETLDFLNSLKEPVSNDLEDFAKKESESFAEREYEIDYIDRSALAKGYYWGVKAGAQLQKEQIMKNAVEAVIHPYDGEIWVDKDLLSIYNDCQRVKLIIIEEE